MAEKALRRLAPSGAPRLRVVVVGTGWGGARLTRDLDLDRYSLNVLSLRNHMVFTPLLAQTTTGTLEFRSTCEAIRRLQPALANDPHEFYLSQVVGVQPESCVVHAQALDSVTCNPLYDFKVEYDKLVLAHGAFPNTFGTPGVHKFCHFLREVSDARAIRTKVLGNLALASLPGAGKEEKERLLHTVIVGGGPIGTEFAGDLSDFKREDIAAYFPKLVDLTRVTLVEPGEVLASFDARLRSYAARQLQKQGVHIIKSSVREVKEDRVVLRDGSELHCGLVVWGTGVGPSRLTRALPFDTNQTGRIKIDDFLRVYYQGAPLPNVYALGDAAGNLPGLAAVANKQGKYLASTFNREATDQPGVEPKPFHYRHMGSMATVGGWRAVADFDKSGRMQGLIAFLLWRSAYFTMLGTFPSRVYMALNWTGSFVFGRDFTMLLEPNYYRKTQQSNTSMKQGSSSTNQ